MARPPRCRDTGAHTPPGSAATVLWQCVPPRVYHRPLPLQPHLLLQVTERHPIPDLEVNQIIPPPVLPHPVAARRAGWEATGSAPESEGGRAQAARRLQAAPTSCCWRPGLCRQPTSSPSLVSQLQHKRGVLRQGCQVVSQNGGAWLTLHICTRSARPRCLAVGPATPPPTSAPIPIIVLLHIPS